MNPSSLAFRPDLEGVRGFAVLCVVLFHFGVPWISGGYIGVDVFFVLSGFFIACLLRGATLRDLPVFYVRRLMRLVPAHLLVLLATMGLVTFLMLPRDYVQFFKGAYSTTLFKSNLFFQTEVNDYFAADARTLPLLHTWSLAVEWQFYLFFPIVYVLAAKAFGWGRMVWLLSLLTALGAGYSVHAAHGHAVYFSTGPRVFEMLLGACMAFFRPAPSNPWSSLCGHLCIAGLLLVAMLLDEGSVYPGASALLVCVLSAGLILTGPSVPSLSAPALRYLGRISYALYLWHWPFIALAAYMAHALSWPEKAMLLLVITALAHASTHWVEDPVRRWQIQPFAAFILFFVLPLTVVRGVYLWTSHHQGFPGRLGIAMQVLEQKLAPFEDLSTHHCMERKGDAVLADCTVSGVPMVFAMGDSHAKSQRWALAEFTRGTGMGFRLLSAGNCLMLLGVDNHSSQDSDAQRCRRLVDEAFEEIERIHPRCVVLIQRWNAPDFYSESALQGLYATVKRIVQAGAIPIVFGQAAESGEDMYGCFYQHIKMRQRGAPDCHVHMVQQTEAGHDDRVGPRVHALKKTFPTLQYVDLRAVQCHSDTGLCDAVADGLPMYDDSHHLNGYGADVLAQRYLARFGNPLRRQAQASALRSHPQPPK